MEAILFLLLLSSSLRGKAYSQTTCEQVTGSIPEYEQISEIKPPDTMIFNVSKSSPVNISYSINNTWPHVLQTYFRDFQNDSLFILYLNKTLDLEELYSVLFSLLATPIELIFNCNGLKKTFRITINGENEFYPYVNISGNLNVPENTPVGTVVYDLVNRTSDEDRPVSRIFIYEIVNNMFRLNGAQSGQIILASPLDYESGQRTYLLNISVKDTTDEKAKTSFASLWINVTDVDDQGPQFDYPDCVAPCLIPEYTAITDLSYTGPLKVQPASIKAYDRDTFNIPIEFSFYSETSGGSSSIDSSGFFRIDQNNGTVYQLKPASGALWPNKRLVVNAKEVGSNQSEAHAILMVRVLTRDPTLNDTSVPPDRSTPTEGDKSLLPAVIALSVLMGVILIAAAIVIFMMHRRHRKMVCPEDTTSEPSTEEEDIHSERSEEDKKVLPTRAKTMEKDLLTSVSNPLTDPVYLNRPLPKKGTLLEPLQTKDTGTGTNTSTTKKKKKKSRTRFKKKNNEIFDGTKAYNMEADPTFYESPDKSRIKRSARSMKVPSEHIVVQNDNAEYLD